MHKHHIIPRHMGGSDDPSNLVEVTIEQHAELHLDLYLTHGKQQDWLAFHALGGWIDREEAHRQACSIAGKAAVRCGAQAKATEAARKANTGKKLSEEHKAAIGRASRRKTMSEDAKHRISEAKKGQVPWNKGVPRTEETKAKIRETKRRKREQL